MAHQTWQLEPVAVSSNSCLCLAHKVLIYFFYFISLISELQCIGKNECYPVVFSNLKSLRKQRIFVYVDYFYRYLLY